MKIEYTPLFGNIFGGKSPSAESERSIPVVVTTHSQPHVLQQKMKDERLSHGETVTVNISPVRLESSHGRMVMYFCPMKSLEILETISDGDGGSIPMEADVEGLSVPDNFKSGIYMLKNVTLSSNGTIQVKATSKTEWENV